MKTQEEDSELLNSLQFGDKSAFATIYNRYARDLFRYVRKNISTKEDCEEIIQDIFVDLWNRREKLGHITSLQAYLYQMVRYKVIRHFQHKGVVRKFETHYRFFGALYENPNFEEESQDSVLEQVVQTLTDLPARCQEAIRLRIFENLSNNEIAERMNITKKTVEVYMTKAFNHLRAHGKHLIQSK